MIQVLGNVNVLVLEASVFSIYGFVLHLRNLSSEHDNLPLPWITCCRG
jgi:hypothetical protein